MFKNTLIKMIKFGRSIINFFIAESTSVIRKDPSAFSSGVYKATKNINSSLTGLCSLLLVCFCMMSVIKSAASLTELKRPEVSVKIFLRFILAEAASVESFAVMDFIFSIFQAILDKITDVDMFKFKAMPKAVEEAINDMNFGTQTGSLMLTVLFIILCAGFGISILITVYTRFFKMYMYAAI